MEKNNEKKPKKTANKKSKSEKKISDSSVGIAVEPTIKDTQVLEADKLTSFSKKKKDKNVYIVCEGLNVFYNKEHALKDVNFVIRQKKITALIGPSGCGKSTFIRTLNRMNDFIPNCRIIGKVIYDSQNIYDRKVNANEIRSKIGMVFQKPNPFPMSIFDNVAYGLRIHGIKKKTVVEELVVNALKKAAIWDEIKNKLSKSALGLSGGQQQRLCIARAIAMKPDVLLMDEPTSSLDPISTIRIEELTQELRRDYTIVVVTHSLHQAARFADYTAFFYEGEIVEYGKTRDIFTNPQHKRTWLYVTGRSA